VRLHFLVFPSTGGPLFSLLCYEIFMRGVGHVFGIVFLFFLVPCVLSDGYDFFSLWIIFFRVSPLSILYCLCGVCCVLCFVFQVPFLYVVGCSFFMVPALGKVFFLTPHVERPRGLFR